MKIEREEREVVAILDNFRIEGTIHLPPGGRISDFFNIPKTSMVMTKARVFLHRDNQLLYRIGFIVLNRELIKGIFPQDEIQPYKKRNKG